jgi:hypothetical protein
MHFLIGIFIFLYFLIRSSMRRRPRHIRPHHLYDQAARAFGDLASQYGGNANRAGWRKLIYVTPDRVVELQFNADSRRLVIRLRKSFAAPFSFYRLPRLTYAFLDAFLQPGMKIEGTHYLIGSKTSELMSEWKNRNGFVPLMQKLDHAGFSGQTTQYGLKLWKTLHPADVNDVAIMSYIRLVQDLARLCDREEVINIPVQPLSSDKRCAYCKELLSQLEPAQYCQWCGTPHHQECFELNGKCTVYGCERPVPQQQEQLTL